MKIKKATHSSDSMLYILIAVLCALVFISIYGVYVLIPQYTDWLMAGGDLSQHYLGWVAYRNSDWHFPIGMVDGLAYPYETSIIFTDSIPLVALFFKILSPILPDSFQYFGLWGICTFMLQGLMAAKILSKYTDNKMALVVCALLFVYTPIMIYRMYYHTALAGHWILLLALQTVFSSESFSEDKHFYSRAGLLGLLTGSVHIYFILMNGIVLLGACLLDMMQNKRVKRSIIALIVYILTAAVMVAFFGGFDSGMMPHNGGLGRYSFNLNGLYNPQGWSSMFDALPVYTEVQMEGFAYLGAGFLFLLLMIPVLIFCKFPKNELAVCRNKIFALLVIILISAIVAISPVITFGENVIWEIPLPESVFKLWSVFRASGRVIWTPVYIIMLCSCIFLCRLLNKKMLVCTLLFTLLLQGYDMKQVLYSINKEYNQETEYQSLLQDVDFWNAVSEIESIEHIVYCDEFDKDTMYSVFDWASKNKMTTNSFYFARPIMDDNVSLAIQESLNKASDEYLFLFSADSPLQCINYNLNYYSVDQFLVGYSEKIDGFSPISKVDLIKSIDIGDNICFMLDGYNASPYIESGIYSPETWGSWTSGNNMVMYVIINSDVHNLQCEMDMRVFNNQQHVVIRVNEEIVYDNIITEGPIVFDFNNPGLGEVIKIEFTMPDAVSPKDVTVSSDARILALGIKNMYFCDDNLAAEAGKGCRYDRCPSRTDTAALEYFS